jgi:hypothetical protein
MNALLMRLESDISISFSSLHCLKVEPIIRKRIADSLIPNSKLKVSAYQAWSFYTDSESKGHTLCVACYER